MSAPWLRIPGLMVVSSWLVVGCSSAKKIEVGGACILNSDCNGSLVCTAGKCHDACHTTADCPPGQSCMKTSDSVICQLPAEVPCSGTSTCRTDFSCAPDQHCRTSCYSVANCTPGQVCVSNFCAETSELKGGQLPQTAGSDAGIYDASSPDLTVVSPADLPPAVAGPEAGVTYDASLDAPAGPDAPVAPLDVAAPDLAPDLTVSPPDTTEAGLVVGVPDASLDIATSPPDAPEAGLVCPNNCEDGLSCTTDTCVAGVCQNTPKLGYCVIEKACYADGDTKPGDSCQACSITASTSAWSPQPEGTPCGVGKSCQSRTCAACGNPGQACCGASPGTCAVGATCDSGTKTCQADKAIDISGAGQTFCALFQSGRVRCWGGSGPNLGIGTNTSSNVAAAPVAGLNDAMQISVGYSGVCAVRNTGAVVCWGDPVTSGASTNSPVAVPGITDAKQVSVGYQHACVRTANGNVLCWGANDVGQFGDDTSTGSSTPTQMHNVADAQTVVACGKATCVLRVGGQVSCTGAAYHNGQATNVSAASNLASVPTASSLSCANFMNGSYGLSGFMCAVGVSGGLSRWGCDWYSCYLPAPAAGVGQVLAAISDGYSYLAIQQDRSLWALGTNNYGQLGDGTFASATYHTSPRLAHANTPLAGVVAVAALASSSSCLLRDDGSVSCAGYDDNEALGDGQFHPEAARAFFVPVVGILPVASEDGQCFDGVDNDGNGKTDLDDPACAQDLGSATGPAVATVPFAGAFGNYLQESCNVNTGFGNYGGPEAVLVWTAPSGGTYQFDTSGSSFDTVLAAFKGNPLTMPELACNDDGATLSNGASAIQAKVITGDKLTLVVDSKTAPTGPASFTLNITKQ